MSLPTPYYQNDLGTLYHGDCMDILPHLEPVDLCLTDPPYGTTQNKWDIADTTISVIGTILKRNALIMTCNNPMSSIIVSKYLDKFKWSDVYIKSHATGFLNCKVMPLRQHEDILYLSKNPIKYFPQVHKKNSKNVRPHCKSKTTGSYGNFNETRKRTISIYDTYPRSTLYFDREKKIIHPTQKPTALFTYLLNSHSDDKDIILDPFIGSGTTAVACERLKRRWIGIEISLDYCRIAKERIERERKQLKLF